MPAHSHPRKLSDTTQASTMALVRPRLTDHHNITLMQDEADFVIPFLDEDIPLCLDPFLLWKSPSYQDNSLYASISSSFNHIGHLANSGRDDQAIEVLTRASECDEVGLGFSESRTGTRIGRATAEKVLTLFRDIPQIKDSGFIHFEEIQLYVDQIAKDRISDIACNFLKSWLIDYTMDQCRRIEIPTQDVQIPNVYSLTQRRFIDSEKVCIPVNPETGKPLLLVPKRWLRKSPWINYDDYEKSYYATEVLHDPEANPERMSVLNFNRMNYDAVQTYVRSKERAQADCKNDPLFRPIPILSAKRKIAKLTKLPSGTADKADKQYEDLIVQVMASMLYPYLDFAAEQSRTESGAVIRDLVFYNNRNIDFLKDIYNLYGSRQLVLEMKNVKAIEREHINQLNRYLVDTFGRFGVLVTRNPLPKAMFQQTIDLWSGQRRCIIALTDEDISLMAQVFENKQRLPIEVLKAKYIEFTRKCPS